MPQPKHPQPTRPNSRPISPPSLNKSHLPRKKPNPFIAYYDLPGREVRESPSIHPSIPSLLDRAPSPHPQLPKPPSSSLAPRPATSFFPSHSGPLREGISILQSTTHGGGSAVQASSTAGRKVVGIYVHTILPAEPSTSHLEHSRHILILILVLIIKHPARAIRSARSARIMEGFQKVWYGGGAAGQLSATADEGLCYPFSITSHDCGNISATPYGLCQVPCSQPPFLHREIYGLDRRSIFSALRCTYTTVVILPYCCATWLNRFYSPHMYPRGLATPGLKICPVPLRGRPKQLHPRLHLQPRSTTRKRRLPNGHRVPCA